MWLLLLYQSFTLIHTAIRIPHIRIHELIHESSYGRVVGSSKQCANCATVYMAIIHSNWLTIRDLCGNLFIRFHFECNEMIGNSMNLCGSKHLKLQMQTNLLKKYVRWWDLFLFSYFSMTDISANCKLSAIKKEKKTQRANSCV